MTARPIREVLIAAVHAQLTGATTATVQRSRRADVDTQQETLPILLVHLTAMNADPTAEATLLHWDCTVEITGLAGGRTDALADQAVSDLHAAVVAALDGWSPNDSTFDQFAAGSCEFRMHQADESPAPVGEFAASFTIRAIAASGSALAQE